MFCKSCGFKLRRRTELTGKCPACGHPFDPNDPNTFRGSKARFWLVLFITVIAIVGIASAVAFLIQFSAASQAGGH